MWRHVASNALTFFIIALFLLAGVVMFGARQYSEPGPLSQAICLRVESGTNMRAVSRNLESQGAISSGTIFRIAADYSEKAGQLKAGSFLIPARATMEEITDIITRGGASTCGTEVVYRIGVTRSVIQVRELDPADNRYVEVAEFERGAEEIPAAYLEVQEKSDTRYRVAMAEGVTSWQVVDTLNAIDTLGTNFDGVPPEGSLAPDSYEFTPGTAVAAIIDRMTERQSAILAEAWAGRAEGLPLASPEEALILASIVEKETGGYDEVRTVASVFENRLNRGMRLQTDPTVIYGITNGVGVLGRGLRQSELRAETPYNTYVIEGLPPTPIANPGRLSIEAVMNPEKTEYIFFVAKTLDPRDGHNFAANLDDHNRNVAAYRALEAEAAANQ